ncbi:MAG: hypothetical protein ACRENQ_14445, partial [Gemmatimonadaceae bacterium]
MVAAVGLRAVGPRGRWWATLSTVGLGVLVLLAGFSQWKLDRIDQHWTEIRTSLKGDALAALQRRVDEAATQMRTDADRALAVPEDTTAAFHALEGLVPPGGSVGMVLYENGEPLAWSGRVHVPTAALHDSIGVAWSDFYTSLFAVAHRGGRRAVVTQVLDATPPADRLTHPIA